MTPGLRPFRSLAVPGRPYKRLKRVSGTASREAIRTPPDEGNASQAVLKSQQDDKRGLWTKLVAIQVDARVYHEVVAKPRKGLFEVTRTFSDRGNAELVYEISGHGITDLSTSLLDLPEEFWRGRHELADRVLKVPGFCI